MFIIQVWTTDKDYNAILENNVDSLSKADHHEQVKGTQVIFVLMKVLCGNRINRMDTDIMIKKN